MDFDIKLFKQLKENKDVKKLHETEDRIKTPEELKDEAYQYFQDCKMVPTFEDIMDYVASALEVQHNIIIDDDKYKELAKELGLVYTDDEVDESSLSESPIAEPTTTPTTRPTTKPRTPIVPQPNIQPKPKAIKNKDVELFKQARESRNNK